MVSLENTRNPKGGFSFEPVTPTNDDLIETISTTQNDRVPLTAIIEPNFKKIGTTFAIIIQILTIVIIELAVFLIPYFCGSENKNCSSLGSSGAYDLIIYSHAGFWLIKFLFDRFYHHHHMRSRRNGYLEFYRSTRLIRSLPLIIISAGNSLLLVIEKVLNKYCPVKCTSENLTPENFLQIFITLESLLLMPILIYYLQQTIIFNRSKISPDISKEIDRPTFLPAKLKDIGYKDSSYIQEILENQADMIRYLQERNETLAQKLYQTNSSNIN